MLILPKKFHPKLHKDDHKKGGADAFATIDELILALENLAADPASVKAGRIFYHTVHKFPHVDDGIAIKDLASAYDVFKDALAYNSIIAGTWAIGMDTSQWLGCRLYNSSAAQNDGLRFKFTHKAGSFTFTMVCIKGTNGGIIEVFIDDVSQGTIDLYKSATEYNYRPTLAITIVTDGEHTLDLKVTSKNASSAGYALHLSCWSIRD